MSNPEARDKEVADLQKELDRVRRELVAIRASQKRTVRKRSSRMLWGMPLCDIALGPDPRKGEKYGHARGVIAIGDVASGIFALGIVARGVVSLGVVSLGVFAVGVASGAVLFALGPLAVAPIAFGGLAIGIVAFGVNAIGIFADGVWALGVKTGFLTGLSHVPNGLR